MGTKSKILALLLVLMLPACRHRGSEGSEISYTRGFPKAVLPAMIQDSQEAAEWLALHFWDGFFCKAGEYGCDSSHVEGVSKDELEQQMANYIYILDNLPMSSAIKAMTDLSNRIEQCEEADTSSTVFETFKVLGEKYLFDPNSPLRNEDYYEPMAKMFSMTSFLTQSEKDRFRYISEKSRLNKVGTKAADFSFTDKRGRSHTLYGIRSEYILLFFSNPGCESCMEIINSLKSSPKVTDMISTGRMAVLNIYIDEDLQAWKDYMPVYPQEWYNGFDPDLVLRNNDIYNIRAIPSLYLLDKDKTVLLKDAVPEKLFDLIERL